MIKITKLHRKMKFLKINKSTFYMLIISSRSNEPSNSSNSSSKLKSIWINFIKLEGGLHPFLGSLSQFLLTKIKFSKFSNCKQHLLRFVNMPTKEKINSISICDLTMPKIWRTKKTNYKKHGFMTSPPLKRTLDVCGIHLVTFETQ